MKIQSDERKLRANDLLARSFPNKVATIVAYTLWATRTAK